MADVFVRNRRSQTRSRERHFGKIPLSTGEIEYLTRQDDATRRRQRLLQVRDQEKRAAQLVTQRYRDNLRKLQSYKLQLAQRDHRRDQETVLTALHEKYQYSLQGMGTAQRNAREKVVDLMELAQLEQRKWSLNRRGEKLRFQDAIETVHEDASVRLTRRREIERNLTRLKEMSAKHRSDANARAILELEQERHLQKTQQLAQEYRQQHLETEEFSFPRKTSKDVTAYQFTRTHCVAVPGTRAQSRSAGTRTTHSDGVSKEQVFREVKVIRHNRNLQPSSASAIDQAERYRHEMERKREHAWHLREKQAHVADSRGEQALHTVESIQEGARALDWLAELDRQSRVETMVMQREGEAMKSDQQVRRHETRVDHEASAGSESEAFARMFGIDEGSEGLLDVSLSERDGQRDGSHPEHITARRAGSISASDDSWLFDDEWRPPSERCGAEEPEFAGRAPAEHAIDQKLETMQELLKKVASYGDNKAAKTTQDERSMRAGPSSTDHTDHDPREWNSRKRSDAERVQAQEPRRRDAERDRSIKEDNDSDSGDSQAESMAYAADGADPPISRVGIDHPSHASVQRQGRGFAGGNDETSTPPHLLHRGELSARQHVQPTRRERVEPGIFQCGPNLDPFGDPAQRSRSSTSVDVRAQSRDQRLQSHGVDEQNPLQSVYYGRHARVDDVDNDQDSGVFDGDSRRISLEHLEERLQQVLEERRRGNVANPHDEAGGVSDSDFSVSSSGLKSKRTESSGDQRGIQELKSISSRGSIDSRASNRSTDDQQRNEFQSHGITNTGTDGQRMDGRNYANYRRDLLGSKSKSGEAQIAMGDAGHGGISPHSHHQHAQETRDRSFGAPQSIEDDSGHFDEHHGHSVDGESSQQQSSVAKSNVSTMHGASANASSSQSGSGSSTTRRRRWDAHATAQPMGALQQKMNSEFNESEDKHESNDHREGGQATSTRGRQSGQDDATEIRASDRNQQRHDSDPIDHGYDLHKLHSDERSGSLRRQSATSTGGGFTSDNRELVHESHTNEGAGDHRVDAYAAVDNSGYASDSNASMQSVGGGGLQAGGISSYMRQMQQEAGALQSSSSSFPQYSLPLSDSFSSMTDSLLEPDGGLGTLTNQLLPMFPHHGRRLSNMSTDTEMEIARAPRQHEDRAVTAATATVGETSILLDGLVHQDGAFATDERRRQDLRRSSQEVEPIEGPPAAPLVVRSEDLSVKEAIAAPTPGHVQNDISSSTRQRRGQLQDLSFSSDSSSDMSAFMYLTRMREVASMATRGKTSGQGRRAARSSSSESSSGTSGSPPIPQERSSPSVPAATRRDSIGSSASSTPSIDARFQYLMNMTAVAGKALPLYMNLPPADLSRGDMRLPPPQLKLNVYSSDSEDHRGTSHSDQLDQHGQPDLQDRVQATEQPDSASEDATAEPKDVEKSSAPIQFALPPAPFGRFDRSKPPPSAFRTSASASSSASSSSSSSSSSSASSSVSVREKSDGGNSGHSHSHDFDRSHSGGEPIHQYALEELSERLAALPPPPMGSFDMSQPPAPLPWADNSDSEDGDAESALVESENTDANPRSDHEQRSDAGHAGTHAAPRKKGEALFVPLGSTDDSAEQAVSEQGSLADAFRQRHPRFHQRAQQANKSLLDQRREQLAARRTATAAVETKAPVPPSPSKPTTRPPPPSSSTPAAAQGGRPPVKSALSMPPPALLDRLATGERAKISAQEMRDRTRRLYSQLPEVAEKKRQENLLERRRQRLAEMRDREKLRRQQQQQRQR